MPFLKVGSPMLLPLSAHDLLNGIAKVSDLAKHLFQFASGFLRSARQFLVRLAADVIQTLPSRFVYRNHLAPIARENGTLKVVTSDPFNLYVFDEIKLLTGLEVQPVLAPRGEIDKVIKDHYGVGGDTIEEMAGGDDYSLKIGRAHV